MNDSSEDDELENEALNESTENDDTADAEQEGWESLLKF